MSRPHLEVGDFPEPRLHRRLRDNEGQLFARRLRRMKRYRLQREGHLFLDPLSEGADRRLSNKDIVNCSVLVVDGTGSV